jgi:hypothetical protein
MNDNIIIFEKVFQLIQILTNNRIFKLYTSLEHETCINVLVFKLPLRLLIFLGTENI